MADLTISTSIEAEKFYLKNKLEPDGGENYVLSKVCELLNQNLDTNFKFNNTNTKVKIKDLNEIDKILINIEVSFDDQYEDQINIQLIMEALIS